MTIILGDAATGVGLAGRLAQRLAAAFGYDYSAPPNRAAINALAQALVDALNIDSIGSSQVDSSVTGSISAAQAAADSAASAAVAAQTSADAANASLILKANTDLTNVAANAVKRGMLEDGIINAAKLAAGAISSQASFGGSLRAVEIVSALPALPSGSYPSGAVVVLTTDGKLYRSTGSAWTAAVPTSDLTGTLSAGSFATSLRPPEVVSALPTLPSASYPQGVLVVLTTDNKLYRSTGSAWTATVPTSDLTGQIGNSQIAAGAITAGKITAGTITANELAANSVTASQIAAGAVATAKLAAGAVTANELAANSVTAGKVAAGSISASEIAAGAIGTTQLAANAVTAAKIAAGTISADKLVVGFGGNLLANSSFTQGAPSAINTSKGGVDCYASSGAIAAQCNVGLFLAGSSWAPSGVTDPGNSRHTNQFTVQQVGSTPGAYVDTWFPPASATENAYYLASAYVAGHRCDVSMSVQFENAAGSVLGYGSAGDPTCYSGQAGGGQNLSGYKRIYIYGQAPAGTTLARVLIRKYNTSSGADSWLFLLRAMLEEINGAAVSAGTAVPSPWAPCSPTIIDEDGIRTGAITATKIKAGSLQTTNYAEDGSGFPTAGAKLDHQGTALKVAAGNLRVGKTLLTDAWLAQKMFGSVTVSYTAGGGLTYSADSPFVSGVSAVGGYVVSNLGVKALQINMSPGSLLGDSTGRSFTSFAVATPVIDVYNPSVYDAYGRWAVIEATGTSLLLARITGGGSLISVDAGPGWSVNIGVFWKVTGGVF